MKKVFAIVLASVFFVSATRVEAGLYTCENVTNITQTSAEIVVRTTAGVVQSHNVGVQAGASGNLILGTPYEYSSTSAKYSWGSSMGSALQPGTAYTAKVYNRATSAYVEEIAKCNFTTLSNTPPPPPTNNVPTNPQSGTNVPPTPPTNNVPTNPQSGGSNSSGSTGGGFILDVKLQNPLKVDSIEGAIKFFVNTLIKIAIPIIVVFFIWAGLKFILARGKPDEIVKAKQMFWYTIIGTLLILGAWTITNAIIGTVNSITN